MEINKLLSKQKKNVCHPPVDDKDPSIFSWKRFWQARGITVWKWSKTWRWEITDMFWGMMNWKHLKLTHPTTQVVLFHVYMGTWASWRGICGGSLLFCLPGIHSSFLSYNNLSYSERGVLAFPLDLELRGAPPPPRHCQHLSHRHQERVCLRMQQSWGKHSWETEGDWLDFSKNYLWKIVRDHLKGIMQY